MFASLMFWPETSEKAPLGRQLRGNSVEQVGHCPGTVIDLICETQYRYKIADGFCDEGQRGGDD